MGEVTISGLIEGGKATSGPPFGPALGPLGVNVAKIIADINAQTGAYAGIKVPVKIIVDQVTKNYRVEIGAPTTSALILKELGIQKGAKTKDEVVGDITIEQAKKVASAKNTTIYGKTLADKVKQVLGTCKSMNITVEGMPARDAIAKINSGEIKIK
jgi:large subunit ribosomal protein L11